MTLSYQVLILDDDNNDDSDDDDAPRTALGKNFGYNVNLITNSHDPSPGPGKRR